MKFFRLLFTAVLGIQSLPAQGPLSPPGAPAPTMKTLDQIEARTPISGLPIRISQPGSYYLTRSFTLTAASLSGFTGAIEINTGNVTVDLNGFTISSTAEVQNQSAISVTNFTTPSRSIRIINGTIRGTTTVVTTGAWPNKNWIITPGGFSNGIEAQSGFSFEFSKLTVIGCRQDGLRAGPHSSIHHVTAEQNGGTGIKMIFSSAVEVSHCISLMNGADGISAGGVISHCHSSSNGGMGFLCQSGTLTHCVSRDNFDTGIDAVSGNISFSMVLGNGGDGIKAGLVTAFCTATGNNRRGNGSTDIDGNGSRTGNFPSP